MQQSLQLTMADYFSFLYALGQGAKLTRLRTLSLTMLVPHHCDEA